MLACEAERGGTVDVVTFTAAEAAGLPNAYLLLGEREALLVDTVERRSDVTKLGDAIEKSGRKLTTIFITHAHADHLLGLAQLLERFPGARAVTTPGVIEDAENNRVSLFSTSSRRYREDGPLPLVIPEPVAGDSLSFEGTKLRVLSFENGESAHAAALYDPASRSLFAGDLVFSETHLLLREKRLAGWRAQLEKAEAWARQANVARVYPGHGPVGSATLFAENRRYIDEFSAALETPNDAEIRRRMLARYPRHRLPQNLETSIRAFIRLPDD
jgi:glyoxylase-like metal-dependent hydrolase (beta-lactamase superfamily II)